MIQVRKERLAGSKKALALGLLMAALIAALLAARPAVAAGNEVLAWGNNDEGQLGDGAFTDNRKTPVSVTNLDNAETVSGGCHHSLALKNDGKVWAWGFGEEGELGNGNNVNSNTPVQVSNLTGVKAIAAGCYHSLALKDDGTVWAWGSNSAGQLGNGTGGPGIKSNVPVQVSNLSGVKAIASGHYHSLALKADGTVRTWGLNDEGRLGDGTDTSSNTPVQVKVRVWFNLTPLTGVKAIAGGAGHSLALKEDGTVRAWGGNYYGQLGDGTETDRYSAVTVKTPKGDTLGGVEAIAAGGAHNLALKEDGTVRAWGRNSYGQLGDRTKTDRTTAVKVRTARGGTFGKVKAIAAGEDHSLALKEDGTVRAWGFNNEGELGNGTATNRKTPVAVKTSNGSNLGGVKAIAGGRSLSLAVEQ